MARWTVYLEGGPRRVNHAAVAIGSKIYSFGGYCSGDTHELKQYIDIHVLDTATYRWSRLQHTNISNSSTTLPTNNRNNDDDETSLLKSDVPLQRYGHTAVEYKRKAYIWGGRNDEYGASNALHEFDPVTGVWARIDVKGFIPPARDGHTAVVVDDKMIIFGGFEEDLQRFSQETYVFDFTKKTWSEMITKNAPPLWRDFHTAVVIDYQMYIFGGRSDQSGQVGDEHLFHSTHDFYDGKLMALDLLDATWNKIEVVGKAPGGRRSHSAWVHGGKMYMFGGYLGTKNVHYNELYCFDPKARTWSVIEVSGNYPAARRRHCTVIIDDRVFLFGGTMPTSTLCSSGLISHLSTSGLADLCDLHVLDYSPTLKQLALLRVLDHDLPRDKMYDCMKEYLPLDIRRNMFCMTAPNQLNPQPTHRYDNSG